MPTPPQSDQFSAQVILTGGQSQRAFADLQSFFGQADLQAALFDGTSFSITGSANAFQRVFGSDLQYTSEGKVRVNNTESLELPLHALPPSVSDKIRTVTFTPPPDFGPAGGW